MSLIGLASEMLVRGGRSYARTTLSGSTDPEQTRSVWELAQSADRGLQFRRVWEAAHEEASAVAVLAMLVTPLAQADSITITDSNSTLRFTRDDPTANLGTPSDPVQLARKLEWTVGAAKEADPRVARLQHTRSWRKTIGQGSRGSFVLSSSAIRTATDASRDAA